MSTKQALPPLPPTPRLDALSAHFKAAHNNDINPDEVVVLVPPDPGSVASGQKCYLSQAHIKWVCEHALPTATKYAKLLVTGERVFWIPKAGDEHSQTPLIKIPLYLAKRTPKPEANTPEVFFNCKLVAYSPASSKASYSQMLQKADNMAYMAITVEGFAFSDIGSDSVLQKIADNWAMKEDPHPSQLRVASLEEIRWQFCSC